MADLLSKEQLRLRAGIAAADATRDADITLAFKMALAIAETYCRRKFLFRQEVEYFTHFDGEVLSLRRYPLVDLVTAVDVNGGGLPDYHLDYEAGLVMFDRRVSLHQLQLTYEGGYVDETGVDADHPWAAPEDLLLALLLIFDVVWTTVDPASAGGSIAAGTIESVTVQDVGTVRFATGDKATAVSAGADGFLPAQAAQALMPYMRELA